MRHLIFFSLSLLLCCCSSQKQSQHDFSVDTGSIARSASYRTSLSVDSILRSFDFSFDTLKILVERPSIVATAPEIIRVTATRGRVIDKASGHRQAIETQNSLDTVAYRQSASAASMEHTATTRIYDPPSGSSMVVIFLLLGCAIFLLCKRHD